LQDRVQKLELNLGNIDINIQEKIDKIEHTNPIKNSPIKKEENNVASEPDKINSPSKSQKTDLSAKSERQLLMDQFFDNNIKSKQSEHNNTTLNPKMIEDLKNDIKIEINNEMN